MLDQEEPDRTVIVTFELAVDEHEKFRRTFPRAEAANWPLGKTAWVILTGVKRLQK